MSKQFIQFINLYSALNITYILNPGKMFTYTIKLNFEIQLTNNEF